jgi:large subunit ribosomal protein L13
MNHTIDATNRALGRIATDAALILRGKDSPAFERNIVSPDTVHITNASKMRISTKKKDEKTYKRYSGYPGGLKHEKMNHLIARKGYSTLLEHAIRGMLPPNRLRPKILKKLTISE